MKQIPFFIIGMALSDLECMESKPFDKVRDLHWAFKIPLNVTLILIISIWGSMQDKTPTSPDCTDLWGDNCTIYDYATLHGLIPSWFTLPTSSVSLIFLALSSDWFQKTLKSWPIKFLGQISFSMYLIHVLVVQWMQHETCIYFLGEGLRVD